MQYFIDFEFDGHNGPLLSAAIIREDDDEGLYLIARDAAKPSDKWVAENVLPLLRKCPVEPVVTLTRVFGEKMLHYIGNDSEPTIVSDSPVDLARFFTAITTTRFGTWRCVDVGYSAIAADVSIYPTILKNAVQHNAWWDACALRAMLTEG